MKSHFEGIPQAEVEELRVLYPTASQQQLEEWRQKYGYSCKAVFQDAVYRRLGLRRLGSIAPEAIKREPIGRNEPLSLTIPKGERQLFAIIGDTQNPFHDERSLTLVENFLQDIKPDYLIYNGDVQDFYQISKFDKDPNRIAEMQGDVNSTKAMFRRHKVMLPNARRILLAGNHEDRLQRFLWTKASELSSLSCLSVSELFNLTEYGIEYLPPECGLMVNGVFLIIHGNVVSKHSGYTAKMMFEKHGGCGICNHSHRGGSYFKRNRFGIYGWWENYCLCSLEPDWIRYPDWQQGFSLVHFIGKRFWVESIPIVEHTLMYGGKIYD